MEEFKELHLKKEILEMYSLPDIGYPVPVGQCRDFSLSGEKIDLKSLLHWLQEYSASHAEKWLSLETAIFRLAIRLAPPDKGRQIRVYGDNWFLMCGFVALDQKVLTIQRRDHLIAAINSLDTGALCACTYRPLDAKSARYLIDLAQNSKYHSINIHAQLAGILHEDNPHQVEKGESYLTYWESGLGLDSANLPVNPWYNQRNKPPIPNNLSAMQLGVCYEFSR